MLEVDSDGSVQENKDQQMKKHFREETQLLTKDEPKWRSHIGVEKEDGKTSTYQLTNDFSSFANG